jgi:hypothetical protein
MDKGANEVVEHTIGSNCGMIRYRYGAGWNSHLTWERNGVERKIWYNSTYRQQWETKITYLRWSKRRWTEYENANVDEVYHGPDIHKHILKSEWITKWYAAQNGRLYGKSA